MSNLNSVQPASSVRRALLALAVLGVATPAFAVSDTWSPTPTDSLWTNSLNWTGGNVPGDPTSTTNLDTATFGNTTNGAVTVDANRNLQNLTFNQGGGSMIGTGYALTGGPLLLTNGGTILATNNATNTVTIGTAVTLQGDGAAYTFNSNLPGTSRNLSFGGAITGTSTGANVTNLTLTGANGAVNNIASLGDGVGGGKLAVLKTGVGQWNFTGNQTYSGGTTISAGTLRTGSGGNTNGLFGTGPITFDGGTLRLGSTTAVFINSPLVVGANGGTLSIRTNETVGAPSISGTGTLTLATDQTGGVVTFNTLNGFGGTVNVAGPVTLRLATAFDNASATNVTINLNANSTFSRQNGTNQANNAANIATIGGLSGTGGFFGGSAAGTANFIYNVGNNNQSTSFAGVVGNGASLTTFNKVGTGTLTLAGTNTYTGGTTVVSGTLQTGNVAALGVGAVSVTGGTLKVGNGTVNSVTIATSTFATGGAGANALSIASGSTLELAAVNSLITSSAGNFALGNINLDLNNLFNAIGTYTLIDAPAVGGTIGTTSFVDADTTNFAFAFAPDANGDAVLTVTANVPEPATLAALGLFGTLALKRRRSI